MKKKVTVIENLGRSKKQPAYGNAHYEIQRVRYGEKVFFRRQKITDGKVTSSSYAYNIDAKRWESALARM